MSARESTAALDARSLTLPDWKGALKRRVKRPRKVDPALLAYGVFLLLYGLLHVALGEAVAYGVVMASIGVLDVAWAVGLLPRTLYWAKVSLGLAAVSVALSIGGVL